MLPASLRCEAAPPAPAVDEEGAPPAPAGEKKAGQSRFRRQAYFLEVGLTREISARCDLREALRYTPVGAWQPGLFCTLRRARGEGRGEWRLDGGVSAGTGSTGEWLLGPRLRFPSGRLAELGIQGHALTDTSDAWRTGRLQSSLSFALQNRPDDELYRRTGLVAFATALPAERLLLGAEYHLDEYGSLATLDEVGTLPGDEEVAFRNPAIEPGRMGSVVLRVEWTSAPIARERIGDLWRHPEVPLLADQPRAGRFSFRTASSLEVARPELGGERALSFTRLVSDQVLIANRGLLRGLKLRLRLAGSWDAPAQKQEALGGWSALRGFPFKGHRGSFSLLGVAEYRRGHAAAFVDMGGVREPAGWSGLLASVGVRAFLWRDLNLSVAWQANGPARGAFPSARILLSEGW